ncbi:MAG: class I SAM-dependent methyltransferase [Bacteroidales bacterium]|jgi:SAM-dependent methyltransferase|nr:class I SAM-dependent methyltransferase [Bacteroidales bacterium]
MNEINIFESNRAAWNEALEYHQKARKNSLQSGFENPDFTTLNRSCDDVLIDHLNNIDFSGKTISQIPCNNGRELLSLMKFGAKEAIGFDISDTAILEAEQLARIAKLNVKFVRTNILEIGNEYNNYFDFIYISEGSLQWFPDLKKYFSIISRLLKQNGNLLIFEIHPFAYFFENGFNPEKQDLNSAVSYFEKGPYSYKDGMDYVGEVSYEAKECFWFMHKMSDILNAMLHNGIEINEFHEYNLEMASNQEAKYDKFPLSYILTGKKK